MAQLSRRHVLGLGIGAIGASWLRPAAAEAVTEAHGMSVFGDLKYPADFHHFDYVNVAAPKGGLFSLIPSVRAYNQSFQTFNSLNAYILKGEGAQGMDMTFAALMVRAGDEPDAMYGLVAKSVRISPDKTGLSLHACGRKPDFTTDSKLTAHDAAFSLTTLKTKGHPTDPQQMRDMVKAEAADDATLVVTFAAKRAATCRSIVASLPIFLESLLRDAAVRRNRRSIFRWAPGHTRSAKFEVNRYIEFERVKDWWGADLPVTRGSYNFDIVALTNSTATAMSPSRASPRGAICFARSSPRGYGRRATIFRPLRTAASSAKCLPDDTPSGAQGWFINTRREKFRDPRVREALIQAFDFEWTNKTIMYGAYARTHSPFQNSDMMASGPPSPEELEAARAVSRPGAGRGVRPAVRAAGVGRLRAGPRACCARRRNCCRMPGSSIKDGKRLLPNGEVFRIEFLLDEPALQPHHAPYIKNLGTLGIEASSRLVDPVQYRARRRGFRFRHDDRALLHVGDAGRWHAAVLLLAGGRRPRAPTTSPASPIPAIDALIGANHRRR